MASTVSPSSSECRIMNKSDSQPPFITNYSINSKVTNRKKSKMKSGSVNKLSKINANMTESINGLNTDYPRTDKEQYNKFSSMRNSNRGQMSAFRASAEDEYEGNHSNIFRTVQHGGDHGSSIDASNMPSNYTMQFRKMMSKLQTRLEEEMSDKVREIERNIDRRLKVFREEQEFSSNGISKTEVKRLINDEKEDILSEAKDSQKMIARKEINDKLESELQEFEKKINNKMENNYQENFEAIKYLSDKVKHCSDNSRDHKDYSEDISSLKKRVHELAKVIGHQPKRSYIGTDSDQDQVWDKVDSKLDRIYEYQKKISSSPSHDSEEKKHMYDKFGDAILGLVKNIVKGNEGEKENDTYEYDQMISYMNTNVDQFKDSGALTDKDMNKGQMVSPDKFNQMMQKMTELVQKWGKNDDKSMTRYATPNNNIISDSNAESTYDKHFMDDITSAWNNKFNDLADEIQEVKSQAHNEIDTIHQNMEEIQTDFSAWRENEKKVNEMVQDNTKQKFEYFAKNVSDIYSLMEIVKKKIKDKTQSKNNEVIFARLNGYGKNIKTINELYKKIKEINAI
jgi:hypothetical protein